ncbi:MAG: S1C family serine protease [Planctomycetota bacterium]
MNVRRLNQIGRGFRYSVAMAGVLTFGMAYQASAQVTDFREAIRDAEAALASVTVDAKAVVVEDKQKKVVEGVKIPRIEILRPEEERVRQGVFLPPSSIVSTAFAVGPDLLVTYTGRPADQVNVAQGSERKLDAKVLAFDYVTGLAMVKTSDLEMESLIVSAAAPEPGLPVVCAWLEEGDLRSDAGMVASHLIATTAGMGLSPEIDFGGTIQNAGAPVLDSTGMVVGVLVPSPSGGLHCVPSSALQRLMEQAEDADERVDLKRGLVGIQFEGGGPLVLEVQENSAASEGGIEAGDLVVQVNDYTVKSAKDVVSAVASARAGEKVEIVVKRDGKYSTATVELKEHPQQLIASVSNFPRGGFPGVRMQQGFELRDGKLLPMEIEPGAFPDFPMDDFFRPFNMPRAQVEGFRIEPGNIEQTLKEMQRQMEQLNEKMDRRR